MVEIRFHGRGGQGTVVASKILADAIAKEGNWVQAYPEFGVERRGSPVVAFIRIDDKPIYDKSRIYAPDDVVVVDPTLVEAIDITEGLKAGGTIIINSDRKPEDFPFHGRYKVRTINATEIAVKNRLGSAGRPDRQHGHRRRRHQGPRTDEARIPGPGHPGGHLHQAGGQRQGGRGSLRAGLREDRK